MIDKNILYNLISCCDAYDEATHPDHAYNSYKILLDILIQNNSTKCYAIKTRLIIYPEVPSKNNQFGSK